MSLKLNYLALAIPGFLIFAVLEYLYARHKVKQNYYRFESTVSNLCIGIAERLMDFFVAASFYAFYAYIYHNFAVFKLPNTGWVWIGLLLATDFVWYWYHRCSHCINLFWSAHIVHHQSEEFNLTVAARITVFQSFVRCGFWATLPLIGFHPAMVTSILILHGAYSFFTHTRIVNRLGILEKILVTPSHHRVHHASNQQYLDKNYGDIFIIWDKLFGTFAPEKEEPKYGLTHQLQNHSFLWQHFHYILEMGWAFYYAESFAQRLRIIFGGPDRMSPLVRKQLEKRFFKNVNPAKPNSLIKNYLKVQVIISLIVLTFFLLLIQYTDLVERLCICMLLLLTVINCCALMQQSRWIFYLEISRLVVAGLYTGYINHMPKAFALITLIIIGAFYLFAVPKRYRQHLFETV